jgi:hypothetical protein
MWLRCPKARIRLSTENRRAGSSKQRHRGYGGSLRRVRCQANDLAYASTLGWMQVEPQQRNAHPREDQSGSMNLPTSVAERVKVGSKNRVADTFVLCAAIQGALHIASSFCGFSERKWAAKAARTYSQAATYAHIARLATQTVDFRGFHLNYGRTFPRPCLMSERRVRGTPYSALLT